MLVCKKCGDLLQDNHKLTIDGPSPMKNGVRIITPICKSCDTRITPSYIRNNNFGNQRVYLLSGTCASGKSSIGKYVEKKYGYILIDGDAISKRVDYDVKLGIVKERNEFLVHSEVINMMLVVLELGYSVFVSYVFEEIDIEKYKMVLANYDIIPNIGILVPNRDECIKRDYERECWTAGEDFIDKWYESQRLLGEKYASNIIDNSYETIEETVELHIGKYL